MSLRRLRGPIAGLLIAAATVAAFAGVARNGFVSFDDDGYLTENPVVREGLTAHGLAWAFTTTEAANWHPLTWISHMIDVELFGLRPAPHHLAGVAIHTANALLLCLLLARLTGSLLPAALVALLFAVHPLRVESVAWASERKDLLAALFGFAALLAYERAARRGTAARDGAVPLLLACSLMAKPTFVTLPFLLLLLDWWPLGRWSPTPGAPPRAGRGTLFFIPPAHLWREKAPLLLLAAASCAATLHAQRGAIAPAALLPLVARLANVLRSYAGYLGMVLWPADLSIAYPHPLRLPAPASAAATVGLLAGLTAAALAGARRRPGAAVGWLWYLGTLVPMIGLVQVGSQAMADRYTYLPATGLLVALAWSLAGPARRLPRPAGIAAALAVAAVIAALAIATARQVALWRDSGTLFSHALARDPGNAVARAGLGVWHYEGGRAAEALVHFREAVRLVPRSAEYRFDRGTAEEALGDRAAAERSYREAIAIDPRYAAAHLNLGILLAAGGRTREARALFERVLALDPGQARAHFNIGAALEGEGRTAEAEARYREAVRLAPGSLEARSNLGALLARQGRLAEAVTHFRAAAAANPGSEIARRNLAAALDGIGRAGGAGR